MYEIRIVSTESLSVNESPVHVCKPEELIPILEPIRDHSQEHFVCITLDGSGNVITSRVITIGLLNHSLVHPRETFRGAITDNAASIIIAHNHPSGSLEPSSQDIAITQQMKEAGAIIGIQVLDHIIVTKDSWLSMKERGLI